MKNFNGVHLGIGIGQRQHRYIVMEDKNTHGQNICQVTDHGNSTRYRYTVRFTSRFLHQQLIR